MKHLYSISLKNLHRAHLTAATLLLLLLFSSAAIAENYWSQVPSPDCGYPTLIKIDSRDAIYLGLWGQGLQRSRDNGSVWREINEGLDNKYVLCMEFDSTGNIFIGTYGSGIFKSTNDGDNWVKIDSGLTNKIVKAIAVSPTGDIYAGTLGGGVFKSIDEGQSWNSVNYKVWYMDVNALSAPDENIILAGTNGDGIFKTTNGGDSWFRSNGGLNNKVINSFMKNSVEEIFCSTMGGNVNVSINHGATWVVYDSSTVYRDENGEIITNGEVKVTSMLFNDEEEMVIGTSETGLWFRDNVYQSWDKANFRCVGVNCLAINSSGDMFAAVPYKGLWRSTTGGEKWDIAHPLGFESDMHVGPVNAYYGGLVIAGARERDGAPSALRRSMDNGTTWDETVSQNPAWDTVRPSSIEFDSTGNCFITSNEGIWISIDDGLNWQIAGMDGEAVMAMAFAPNGTVYCVRNDIPDEGPPTGYVVKSTDGGFFWNTCYTLNGAAFTKVAVNYNGDVYAISEQNGLYRSADEGNQWALVWDKQNIKGIDFLKNDHIIACGLDGVYRSLNDGGNWFTYDLGLSSPSIEKIVITPRGYIFAYQNNGRDVYYSWNEGVSWIKENSGFILSTIKGIAASPDGCLYLCSQGLFFAVDEPSMKVPQLYRPVYEERGVSITPTLSCHKAENAVMYQYQIGSDRQFKSILEEAWQSDTSRTLQREYKYNKDYYWRMRSKTNSSYSDWSQTWVFRTEIPRPLLKFPHIETGGHPTDLTFVWYESDGALQYHFQLSDKQDFSNIIEEAEELEDTTHTVNGLDLYTVYYWRVKALGNESISSWSEEWYFTTMLAPPTLRTPADSTINLPTEVTMTWDTTAGATEYTIQVATDEEFEDMVFEGATDSDREHTISLLDYFTTYFWRIRGGDIEGQSDWSETWCYTTVIGPATLLRPADSTFDVPGEVTLEWEEFEQSASYHLQVSTERDFDEMFFEDSTLTETSQLIEDLANYTQYHWRVRIFSGDHRGLWSDSWLFAGQLAPPVLEYPTNNMQEADNKQNFEWKLVHGATMYEFEMATDPNFSSVAMKEDSLPYGNLTVYDMDYECTYHWHVRAKNDNSTSDWSETWQFTTKQEPGYVFETGPGTASLYPNPFRTQCFIELELKQPAIVSTEIADIYGNILSIPVSGMQSAGQHSFRWAPQDLPGGIYFAKIRIGQKERIFKIIHVK